LTKFILKHGISEKDIRTMTVDNPTKILGLYVNLTYLRIYTSDPHARNAADIRIRPLYLSVPEVLNEGQMEKIGDIGLNTF
jgi:hypothetical protein